MIHHALLHPDEFDAHFEGFLHNGGHMFGSAKYIYYLHLLRYGTQIGICLFPQDSRLLGVDRNYLESSSLQMSSYPVGWSDGLV